ncbi:hypothetical protein V6N12_059027 [Hibiscus sabdariffa]|uniref:Uncharacterized protein n=1 Tax=Hibiscus sabdariffa TaxID=183260 RepID=A0ABR2ETZ1_9ROSI
MPQVPLVPTLECLSSPLALENQRFSKHGRSNARSMIGLDENGVSSETCCARMVTGDIGSDSNFDNIFDLTPDKVIVRDEDCIIDQSGEYPTIAFSDHVHDQIHQCMLQTIIDICPSNETVKDKAAQMLAFAGASGSRFSVLNADDMEYVHAESTEGATTGSDLVMKTTNLTSVASPAPAITQSAEVVKSAGYLASNPPKKSLTLKGSAEQAMAIPMVPGNSVKVVEHDSTGKFSEHRAVSILEQDHEMNFREGIQSGNNRGFKMKSAKENLKTGLTIRKSSGAKTISRPVLTEWVDNVNAQLDKIVLQKELEPGGTSKVIVNNGGSLEVIQEECRHQSLGGLATDPVVITDDSNVSMV